MTSDLDGMLLVVFGILAGITALLFLLAAIDPHTDRSRVRQPKPMPERRRQR